MLVAGAIGAIGSAAGQLLKSLGVDVTAVCHTENVVLVGADRGHRLRCKDFTADRDTYDVILGAVGNSTFGRGKHLPKDRGIYLSPELGPYSQNLFWRSTPTPEWQKSGIPTARTECADRCCSRWQAVPVVPDRCGLPVHRVRHTDDQRWCAKGWPRRDHYRRADVGATWAFGVRGPWR